GSVPYLNNVRGTFLVRETQAPSGYTAAADQTVTINAGETVTITFVDSPIESGGTTEQPTPTPSTGEGATPETGGVTTLPVTGTGRLAATPIAAGEAIILSLLSLMVLAAAYTGRRRIT
ncbi:MAG TPA: hypothetical protein VFL82_08185, partial [Thermomicrobiales bacterium]|nr:hypothetical protein [Thermomicrobiales bacterium]